MCKMCFVARVKSFERGSCLGDVPLKYIIQDLKTDDLACLEGIAENLRTKTCQSLKYKLFKLMDMYGVFLLRTFLNYFCLLR